MYSVKNIISFIVITILIYLGIVFTLSHLKIKQIPILFQTNDFYTLKGGGTYKQFLDFNEAEQYDVIFAGSSKAYKGFDPRIFSEAGIKSFNLGTNGQTLINSFHIVRNYVNSDNCQLLMIDLYSQNFVKDGIESSGDIITNVSKLNCAFDVAKSMNDSRSINFMFMKLFTNSFGPMYHDKEYIGQGFGTSYDGYPEDRQEPLPPKNKEDFKAHTFEVLEDLILHCQKENIKLVFIVTPASKYYYAERHEFFLEKIMPIINQYNIEFLDYAFNLDLSSEDHFHDPLHLNFEGAKIFNKQLIKDYFQ